MKYAVCTLMFVAIGAFVIMKVECRSPMKCPEKCDQSACQKVFCKCDSFQDECKCCSICYKCLGELCHTFKGDACTLGMTCKKLSMDNTGPMKDAGICIHSLQGLTE